MPVKLSDDLVEQARKEAKSADRSITAQIEHWAKLGRSVESGLRHDDVLVLKHADGDITAAFPEPATRASVLAFLRRVAHDIDRNAATKRVVEGHTVYQSDPRGSELIERIEPDGKRTLGRIEHRKFIPKARQSRRGR